MAPHQPGFSIGRPGALIASLPAVLGFVPEKSLVLVSVEDGRMGAVMRVDLSDDLPDHTGYLAEVVAKGGADTVVAVIVDADGAFCPLCEQEHSSLMGRLGESLGEHDVGLYAAHLVDRVAADGRWRCADGCGAGGAVEDPGSSPMAVAAVLDGRRLYARRGELQAVVAMSDPVRASGLAGAIEAEAARRESDWRADPDGCARRDVQRVLAAIPGPGGGSLDEAAIPALASALTDVAVRDTCYALAVGVRAAGAEALWAILARVLPAPWRAEALVLLAFSAYVRGDGPLAGVALEAALEVDSGHRMARMLDSALRAGMRPDQIRELAATGFRLAGRLGIALPGRAGRG
jgi:hypothetical protein